MQEELETETPSADYVKGFNEGYIFSKYMPNLASKMPKDLLGERGQGFTQGRQQYINEKEKERLPFLKTDRLSSLNKQPPSPSKDRDKDGPDR